MIGKGTVAPLDKLVFTDCSVLSLAGDHPEDVKARLKFWAQAVACTVRLCC